MQCEDSAKSLAFARKYIIAVRHLFGVGADPCVPSGAQLENHQAVHRAF